MLDTQNLDLYFENLFKDIDPKIRLDKEQISAIVADDRCALILAGAGTGKTTTMAAKVKYLVDIKKVDPRKILVMSYTKKATQELENLIVDSFGINAHVTTFHSLGLEYIRKIFKDRKCVVVDYNERERIFYEYISELYTDQEKLKNIIYNFSNEFISENLFSKYFINNYFLHETYESFIFSWKQTKIEEANNIGLKKVIDKWVNARLNSENIMTLNGEVVKSAGEAIIANFLYKHGIDYLYEAVYSEIMEDRSVYRPDFTLDLAGEKVYLEYFGMDDEKYNRVKDMKIQLHSKYNNKFIYIEKMSLEKIEEYLDRYLRNLGFIYKDRSDLEIYNRILDNNKLANVFKFKNLLYACIEKITEFVDRANVDKIINEYIAKLPVEEQSQAIFQRQIIVNFYNYYQQKLISSETYGFDYSDLIYYSTK